MTRYVNGRAQIATILGIALGLSCFFAHAQTRPDGTDDAISFQIWTPKKEYRPDGSATIRLTVINQGQDAIYIARGFICGKWSGFSDLRILNSKGQNVRRGGCDAVELPIADADLRESLSNPGSWIRLLPGEIYGEEGAFKLPAQKGPYRVTAELWPPQFSEKQRQLLAEMNIRVLRERHTASVLTIKVK